MSDTFKLEWDGSGEHVYETGVKRGVLYPAVGTAYPKGVVWNGLSGITEKPSGAEETAIYADDIKYLSMLSAEDFAVTLEAYTYPDEFALCDGSAEIATGIKIGQQARKTFGLCYTTVVGNDTDGDDHGYKLHLIYGCKASPSERGYKSKSDSPEAISFSWEIKTTPVTVTGKGSTACLTIDSTKVGTGVMAKIEKVLYGTPATSVGANDAVEARLPLPDEILSIIAAG